MSHLTPTVSDLFAVKPDAWGQPGDETLWDDLMSAYESTPLPESPFDLLADLIAKIEELTGVDLYSLASDDAVLVERYNTEGTDPALATISMTWWNDDAAKLILQRYLDDPKSDNYIESIGL